MLEDLADLWFIRARRCRRAQGRRGDQGQTRCAIFRV